MTTPDETTPATPLALALRLLEARTEMGGTLLAPTEKWHLAAKAMLPLTRWNEHPTEAALRIVAEDRARLEREAAYHRDALTPVQRAFDALRSQLTVATQSLAGLEAANAELRRGLDMMTEEGARLAKRCKAMRAAGMNLAAILCQWCPHEGAGRHEALAQWDAACADTITPPNKT